MSVSDNIQSNSKIDKERNYFFIKFYDRSPDLRCYAQHLTQKARKFKHPIYLKYIFCSLSLLKLIKFITSTLSYSLSIVSHTS